MIYRYLFHPKMRQILSKTPVSCIITRKKQSYWLQKAGKMEKLQEMGAKLYHRVTATIIGIIRTLEVLLALLIIMAVILSAWDIFSAGDLSKLGQTYHFFS